MACVLKDVNIDKARAGFEAIRKITAPLVAKGRMTEVQQATARYLQAGGTLPLDTDAPERLAHARWLLEELRISLFAQQLGTSEAVSLQRITKVLSS